MSQIPPQGPENFQPVRCWYCNNTFYIPPQAVGRTVHCTMCGQPNVTATPGGGPPSLSPGVPAWAAPRPAPTVGRKKSPALAAFLNFFFWGLGYIYAGRAWGWFIFVPWLLLSLAALGAQAEVSGDVEPNPAFFTAIMINLVISIALAWHAYTMVANDNASALP